MSVTRVDEIPTGRGGDHEGVSNQTKLRRFRIYVDNPQDNAKTIEDSGMLPSYLSYFPGSTSLTRRKLKSKQVAGWKIWESDAEYSNAPFSSFDLNAQAFQNPLLRPVRASGSTRYEKAVPIRGYKVDRTTGNVASTLSAILNSTGDEYDSRPDVDVVIWQTNFAWNVNPIPSWFWNYQNCINISAMNWIGTSYGKGCLKMSAGKWSELQQENGYWFWTIEWTIEYARALTGSSYGGWYYILPDRGYNKLASGNPVKILNNDGTLPQAPRLLDGSGGVLANPTTSATVYNTWVCNDMVDFSVLPAPPLPP